MRIIILRHGLRDHLPTFMTSLTEAGLKQAINLVDNLGEYDIDEIYCSPFLRTAQTIYPYCIKSKIKIKIENGIYESTHNKNFTQNNYKCTPEKFKQTYSYLFDIINNKYESFVKLDEIFCNENFYQIKTRVYKFIENLVNKYERTDKTILLVTHMACCNLIKRYFNNTTELNDPFHMGHFCVINKKKV